MSPIAIIYLLIVVGIALVGFLCNAIAYRLERRAANRRRS